MLVNANNPNAAAVAKNVREMAPSLALQLHVLNAGTDQDIDTIFAGLIQQRIGVLLGEARNVSLLVASGVNNGVRPWGRTGRG